MQPFLERRLAYVLAGFAVVTVAALALGATGLVLALDARDDAAAARSGIRAAEADREQLREGLRAFVGDALAIQRQLAEAAPVLQDGLRTAVDGLESFRDSQIELSVPINETVNVETELALERVLQVQATATVPVDETLETTIRVDGPFGVNVPVDVTVPLVLEIPIDLDLDVPINERIPVSTSVPIDLTVPITIDVASTEFGALADALAQGLASLEPIVAALGG